MSKKIIVNGKECDITGSERMPVTYQASPVAELPAAQGFFSVEFTLPYTNKNRTAFDLPGDLPNESRSPFRLLPAQYLEDGVDMKIDTVQLVSVSRFGIKCRFFGGFTSLLNEIGKKSIQEIDLSSLDHVRTHSNIAPKLQGTEGYIYPLINYLDDISGNDVALESMYPSVFLHTVVDQLLEDAGYTLTGDLVNDADYKSILLPFSNKQGEYSTEFLDALKSKMYLESGFTINGPLAGRNLDLTGESNDDFDLIWEDPFHKYHVLIRATYEINVKVSLFALPDPNRTITVYLIRDRSSGGFSIDLPTGGEVSVFSSYEILDSWTVNNADFAGTSYTIDETNTYELNRGDKVYLVFSKSVPAITIIGGSSFTFLEVTDVTDYGIFYDDLWQIAPNLPDIKQTDLLKWIIQAFSCIVQVDNGAKELKLTKFNTVVNNYDRYDWSSKLDLSLEPELSFPLDLAQINEIRYKDDENIVKPEGADYEFTVDNKNLEESAVFYEAPFGVTTTVEEFTDTQDLPRIDILSNQLQPRILIYKAVTLTTSINLQAASVTQSSQTNISVPYFIKPGEGFNLGWRTNLVPKYSVDRINTLTTPRIVNGLFKLNNKDINQLDFTKPVWLDKYKSYFYLIRVKQYESGRSTACELLKI